MVKILVADDHKIVRQGLKKILEDESDFSIIGEAVDGYDAIEKTGQLSPDILLIDLMMPRLNGLEVTSRVKHTHPEIKIVVLSMRSSESYVLKAIQNGADGYVVKSEGIQDLVTAIRTVSSGRTFLSPKITNLAVDTFLTTSSQVPPDEYSTLTAREKEVLQLIAEGMRNEQIAEYLTLSIHTVNTHRRNLMNKLEVKNRAELVKFAYQQGIINGDR